MQSDDADLTRLVEAARARLCPAVARLVAGVHVYPSRGCTYTLDKRRIFVSLRAESGSRLPDCAVIHVLLHELAHVANVDGMGHDAAFHTTLADMDRCAPPTSLVPCPEALPANFNAPCLNRSNP